MTQADIQDWLRYWQSARMVATDKIRAFEHVHLARKYCPCMRAGRFSHDAVTDLQIWRALSDMRQQSQAAE